MQQSAAAGSVPAYTTDLSYPSSFVFGQTPLALVWAAAQSGAPTPSLTEPFTYCDLGCGDGITLNVLAATYPSARFIGVDLNEDHLEAARGMAERGGLDNVEYVKASFTALDSIDLPAFDFIAVHGVYSWVDDEIRKAIHAFARSGLKPGGLVCVQYSCLPGSTVHDPLLNALRALSGHAGGDSAARVRSGLKSLQQIARVSSFFEANPQAAELVRRMGESPIGPLAHDVLNRSRHSFYFSEVRESFGAEHLEFVGSGNLKLNYPELMMPAEALAVYRELAEGAPEGFRAELLDLIVNTASRCDVFRRADEDAAAAAMTGAVGLAALGHLYLQPVAAASGVDGRRRMAQGTAVDLNSPLHLDVLAAVGGGETIGEVLDAGSLASRDRAGVERAMAELYMTRCLDLLVAPPRPATYDSAHSYRLASPLNRILLEETMLVPEPVAFASPALGTAIRIPVDARFRLLGFVGGDLDAVWEQYRRNGRRIVDARGNEVRDAATFRSETIASLPAFAKTAVPELLRLGVLEVDD